MSGYIPYRLEITLPAPSYTPTNVAGLELYGMQFRHTTCVWEGEYHAYDEGSLVFLRDGKLQAEPDDMHALFGDDATWKIELL